MPTMQERFIGAIVGLAVGDALGTTLEFKPRGTFEPIEDIVGGGPFNLSPGQYTDDTSMTLCLAESLVECKCFDPIDQLNRYVRWYMDGYYSSKDYCFDIGHTTLSALYAFQRTGDPWSGPTSSDTAGNGSLMRLAPVPITFYRDPLQAIALSGDSSRTTHGAEEAIDACRYFGALLVGILQGVNKKTLLCRLFEPINDIWSTDPLEASIKEIGSGSFKEKDEIDIHATGYVVNSLEAALWAFYNSESFKDGALMAVNLGDDADTTGAIYGQIAGAWYGINGIPQHWRDVLHDYSTIVRLANNLFKLSEDLY